MKKLVFNNQIESSIYRLRLYDAKRQTCDRTQRFAVLANLCIFGMGKAMGCFSCCLRCSIFCKETPVYLRYASPDSKTNFVLFNTDKPYDDVYQNLLKKGILIKKVGKILHLENCLRTTVGLPQMNVKLLDALKEMFG